MLSATGGLHQQALLAAVLGDEGDAGGDARRRRVPASGAAAERRARRCRSGSRPKRTRASSVRPEPIRPKRPRTSPARTGEGRCPASTPGWQSARGARARPRRRRRACAAGRAGRGRGRPSSVIMRATANSARGPVVDQPRRRAGPRCRRQSRATSPRMWRDVDDGRAARRSSRAISVEQPGGLARGERGRRLVEDDEVGIELQRLGDLDELPLARRRARSTSVSGGMVEVEPRRAARASVSAMRSRGRSGRSAGAESRR